MAAKLAAPRQKAIGVPISIKSVKTPNRMSDAISDLLDFGQRRHFVVRMLVVVDVHA